MRYLNQEVNCTEPSPSNCVPWHLTLEHFFRSQPEAIVIKHFTVLRYKFSLKARVFSPGKPLSLVNFLRTMPVQYPRVEHPKGVSLG